MQIKLPDSTVMDLSISLLLCNYKVIKIILCVIKCSILSELTHDYPRIE